MHKRKGRAAKQRRQEGALERLISRTAKAKEIKPKQEKDIKILKERLGKQ